MNEKINLRGRQYTKAVGVIFEQELSKRGTGIADLKLRDYTPKENLRLNRELERIGTSMDEVKKKRLRALIKRAYNKLDTYSEPEHKSPIQVVYPKIKEQNMFLLNMKNGIGIFLAEQVGTMKQLGNIIVRGITSFSLKYEFENILSGASRITNVVKSIVTGKI